MKPVSFRRSCLSTLLLGCTFVAASAAFQNQPAPQAPPAANPVPDSRLPANRFTEHAIQATGAAARPGVKVAATVFVAYDIFVDPADHPLGAYQVEVAAPSADYKIVGIEGGESAAFTVPPYYDPAAMMNSRVILAALSTRPAAELPTGRTRVARIHVQQHAVNPAADIPAPTFTVRLMTAADADGQPIAPGVHIEPGAKP